MIHRFPDDGDIRFYKHRDAGSILNATVVLLRRNAREAFVPFFALVIPFALIVGIGQALYLQNVTSLFSPEAMASDPASAFGQIFPPWYVGVIVMSVLGATVAQAAVAGYVRLYREGASGEITASLLWDETQRLVLPTFGFYLAYGFLILLSGLINLLPCLGTIIWVGVLFWSLPYAIVTWSSRMTESDTLGEAFARAQDLVKGSWPFAFGTILLLFLVMAIVMFAVGIPVQVATQAVAMGTADQTISSLTLSLLTIPQQVLGYAAYLITGIGGFFLHGRLTADLDGTDLDDDLDLFERGLTADAHSSWTETPQADAPQADAPAAEPPSAGAPAPPARGDDAQPPAGGDDPTPGPGGFRGGGFGS